MPAPDHRDHIKRPRVADPVTLWGAGIPSLIGLGPAVSSVLVSGTSLPLWLCLCVGGALLVSTLALLVWVLVMR